MFILFLVISNWLYYNVSTQDKGYGSLILFLVGMVYLPLFSASMLFVLSLWIGWKYHEMKIQCEDVVKHTAVFGIIAGLLTFALLFSTIAETSSLYGKKIPGTNEALVNLGATGLLFAISGAAISGVGSLIGKVANRLM